MNLRSSIGLYCSYIEYILDASGQHTVGGSFFIIDVCQKGINKYPIEHHTYICGGRRWIY